MQTTVGLLLLIYCSQANRLARVETKSVTCTLIQIQKHSICSDYHTASCYVSSLLFYSLTSSLSSSELSSSGVSSKELSCKRQHSAFLVLIKSVAKLNQRIPGSVV